MSDPTEPVTEPQAPVPQTAESPAAPEHEVAPEAALEAVPEVSSEAAPEGEPEAASITAGSPAAPGPKIPDLSPAACGAKLAELFPALFAPEGPPKPLKLRIQADIQQRAPQTFTRKSLGLFFSRYTTSNAYLKALLNAPHRFDLDGQPAGEIADEHKAAATEELARRRAIVEEKRAAEREARRAAEKAAFKERQKAERPAQGERRAPQAARPQPPGAQRAHQPPRPPRNGPPREPHNRAADEPPQAPVVEDPARRERAFLLRAFETSSLTKANFCALKRLTEAELEAQLEQARRERAERTPRPASPPRR